MFFSPADWQQGDAVRIMYVHVPAAWLASAGYLASRSARWPRWCGAIRWPTSRRWRSGRSAPAFTALCLVTGSLWGKPMWGAWWVWDARLTSVLVLFFLYLGHIALVRAFDDPERGYRAGAILALSAWSICRSSNSASTGGTRCTSRHTITPDRRAHACTSGMLWPLLFTTFGYTLVFAAIVRRGCARR